MLILRHRAVPSLLLAIGQGCLVLGILGLGLPETVLQRELLPVSPEILAGLSGTLLGVSAVFNIVGMVRICRERRGN